MSSEFKWIMSYVSLLGTFQISGNSILPKCQLQPCCILMTLCSNDLAVIYFRIWWLSLKFVWLCLIDLKMQLIKMSKELYCFLTNISFKASQMGHFVMVSLWHASLKQNLVLVDNLSTNTRFCFLYFRMNNCYTMLYQGKELPNDSGKPLSYNFTNKKQNDCY